MKELPEQQTVPHSMEEYLDGGYDYARPRRGEIRQGTIISIDPEQVIVDIGVKRDGIVPSRDLAKLSPEELGQLQVGASVPVYILSTRNQQGELIVSINRGLEQRDWERAEAYLKSNELLTLSVVGYNRGGLLVSFGRLQGFIPLSHVPGLRRRSPNDGSNPLAAFVGQEMPVRIIEVDRRRRRLVMSAREAQAEWRAQQKARLLAELSPGDVRSGVVRNLTSFGAFVDLGGADGLIHVSELSWGKVTHPKEVLEVGQEVDVYILRIDHERQRIGLSLKRLTPDPWTDVEERYAIGQVVKGRITNLTDFGAFAEVEPGIEGLIHISELADIPITHPQDIVMQGEELLLRVIHLDVTQRRMGLSLRQAPLEMPVEAPAEQEVDEDLDSVPTSSPPLEVAVSA